MGHRPDSHMSICLLSMPWATTTRPSLSLGLLSSIVKSEGYECEVLYPNVFLSALIGCNGYEYFANTPSLFGVGEHLFAVDIFGCDALESNSFLLETLRGRHEVPVSIREGLLGLRDSVVPDFLEAYVQEIVRREPAVLGLTCTFNQVLPSVALAKRVKHVLPNIHIVLGGPCVHGPMGECYSRIFKDWIDGVFLGEADRSFVNYLTALSQGARISPIPGMAIGDEHLPVDVLFDELDSLPRPDYSSYFAFREELVREGFKLAAFHSLPFEASRGCWWGEKQHCTFCGLNNEGMKFRRKCAKRVKAELTELYEENGTVRFMAADNILDHRAYSELLPELATFPVPLELFFEMKANVTRLKVEQLRAAGVTWVQPGIESFSDHVLRLMRKGASAVQNVQTLKWLAEFGIQISYNLLVGFPGETDADYAELFAVIARLHHLPAPGKEANVVQVQRFAPFHFAPSDFGIENIRGARYYDFLIPSTVARKEEYAYFFDHDLPADAPVHRHLSQVDQSLETWCSSKRRYSLEARVDFLAVKVLEDGREKVIALDRATSIALILCDEAVSERVLVEKLESAELADRFQSTRILEELDSNGFVLRTGGKALSLIPFGEPQSTTQLNEWLWKWGGIKNSMPNNEKPRSGANLVAIKRA